MLQFIRAFTFFFSGSGCVFLSHVWYVSPSPGVCVSASLALTGRWAHPDPPKTPLSTSSDPGLPLLLSLPSFCLCSRGSYRDLFGLFKQEYCNEVTHFPISIRS